MKKNYTRRLHLSKETIGRMTLHLTHGGLTKSDMSDCTYVPPPDNPDPSNLPASYCGPCQSDRGCPVFPTTL